jgi:hypothetical protein
MWTDVGAAVRRPIGWIAMLIAWVLLAGTSAAQGNRPAGACDRPCPIGIADQDLQALIAKDPKRVPMAATIKYTENGQRLGSWEDGRSDRIQFPVK